MPSVRYRLTSRCEKHIGNEYLNKNAFQWDAYHPLVDCIPACTEQRGVYPSMHWARGVCPGWVSAKRGCLPGGVCLGRHPPSVDKQTPVKYNLRKLCLRVVNILKRSMILLLKINVWLRTIVAIMV